MAATSEFIQFVTDQLTALGHVTTRRMFRG
jgi:TfoX/Sxy family transcriptional regulator of competence genes